MIGRVALLVTFTKAKPKPQSLSRSHIRDLWAIKMMRALLTIFIYLSAAMILNGQPQLLQDLEFDIVLKSSCVSSSNIVPYHPSEYLVEGKSSIRLERRLRKIEKVSTEKKEELTIVTYTDGTYVFVVFKRNRWKYNNQFHITSVKLKDK